MPVRKVPSQGRSVLGWAFFCLCSTACALAVPAEASACETPACQEGFLLPASGTIPANAPGLVWVLDVDRTLPDIVAPTLPDVALVRTDGESEEDVAVTLRELDSLTYLVVPTDGFVEGATYALRVVNFCVVRTGGDLRATNFTVGSDAATPTGLGTLEVSDVVKKKITIDAPMADGTCAATPTGVTREVSLVPSASITPWLALLLVRKDVDARVWSGTSPRAATTVYRLCKNIPPSATTVGLPPGDHEVTFVGEIPGLVEDLESKPGAFELRCGPDDVISGGDAGDDDGGVDGGTTPTRARGGACAIGNGRTRMTPILPLLVLAAASLFRRRRP